MQVHWNAGNDILLCYDSGVYLFIFPLFFSIEKSSYKVKSALSWNFCKNILQTWKSETVINKDMYIK